MAKVFQTWKDTSTQTCRVSRHRCLLGERHQDMSNNNLTGVGLSDGQRSNQVQLSQTKLVPCTTDFFFHLTFNAMDARKQEVYNIE